MILTAENYYTREADNYFMSVSQYKKFMDCEFSTVAWLKGEYDPEPTTAMLEGSYVHAWNDGTLDQFEAEHPKMYSSQGKTKGELKSNFQHCNEMIDTLANDPQVMHYLQGNKEVPLSAEMFGIPWKIKIDVDNQDQNYLLDLKTTKSIYEKNWSDKIGKYVSFIDFYEYMIQVAVYSEVERLARGRDKWKDFYCVAVSKEKVPDHAIIDLTDHDRVREELGKIQSNITRIIMVKNGVVKPHRCEKCDYCRTTKKIDQMIHYSELLTV